MYPTHQQTDLWVALNLAYRQTHRKINDALKRAGLPSLTWYDVLWTIERTDENLRPFEIEERLIFEQSSLSKLLRRIVDDGLLEELPYEGDRRGKVLRITKKGRRVRSQMWEIYGPLIHEEMGKLPKHCNPATMATGLSHLIEGWPHKQNTI